MTIYANGWVEGKYEEGEGKIYLFISLFIFIPTTKIAIILDVLDLLREQKLKCIAINNKLTTKNANSKSISKTKVYLPIHKN